VPYSVRAILIYGLDRRQSSAASVALAGTSMLRRIEPMPSFVVARRTMTYSYLSATIGSTFVAPRAGR
jgi:hypothetical protein